MDFAPQTLPFTDILTLALGGIAAGIYVLVKGGGWAIDGAVSLANYFKISPLIIGFTIIAFGTSLPELVVSVNANLKGYPGLSVGNVIGSNIANILLVIGMTCLLLPLKFKGGKQSFYDMAMLLFASALICVFMQSNVISQTLGGIMVAILLSYILFQYFQAKKGDVIVDEDETHAVYTGLLKSLFFTIIGLVGIALGAELLVRSAVIGATTLGVSEAVIGLTIVALGTSLPELVTCLIAAKRGQGDIVLGIVVGSGVFNILSIIGLTALISPIDLTIVSDKLLQIDGWVMLGITALFALYLFTIKKFTRLTGLVMLLVYVGFTIEQYLSMV